MVSISRTCMVATGPAPDFVDVTDQVSSEVAAAHIRAGRVIVSVPDEGCAMIVNERETGLLVDIKAALERLGAGASPAPIGSPTTVLPVVGGRIHLGMWQRLLLVERLGPARRALRVQIVGE